MEKKDRWTLPNSTDADIRIRRNFKGGSAQGLLTNLSPYNFNDLSGLRLTIGPTRIGILPMLARNEDIDRSDSRPLGTLSKLVRRWPAAFIGGGLMLTVAWMGLLVSAVLRIFRVL